jgi:hypothetical protein
VDIDENDVQIHIDDDKVHIDFNNMGGKIEGHSYKPGLFHMDEVFDFEVNV